MIRRILAGTVLGWMIGELTLVRHRPRVRAAIAGMLAVAALLIFTAENILM